MRKRQRFVPYLTIMLSIALNSFSFGNAHASMALLSLNHSFFAVLDHDALVVLAYGLAHEVVTLAALCGRHVDILNTGSDGLPEGGGHCHGSGRHFKGVGAVLARGEFYRAAAQTQGCAARLAVNSSHGEVFQLITIIGCHRQRHDLANGGGRLVAGHHTVLKRFRQADGVGGLAAGVFLIIIVYQTIHRPVLASRRAHLRGGDDVLLGFGINAKKP